MSQACWQTFKGATRGTSNLATGYARARQLGSGAPFFPRTPAELHVPHTFTS